MGACNKPAPVIARSGRRSPTGLKNAKRRQSPSSFTLPAELGFLFFVSCGPDVRGSIRTAFLALPMDRWEAVNNAQPARTGMRSPATPIVPDANGSSAGFARAANRGRFSSGACGLGAYRRPGIDAQMAQLFQHKTKCGGGLACFRREWPSLKNAVA
jgi:hypothetical protein